MRTTLTAADARLLAPRDVVYHEGVRSTVLGVDLRSVPGHPYVKLDGRGLVSFTELQVDAPDPEDLDVAEATTTLPTTGPEVAAAPCLLGVLVRVRPSAVWGKTLAQCREYADCVSIVIPDVPPPALIDDLKAVAETAPTVYRYVTAGTKLREVYASALLVLRCLRPRWILSLDAGEVLDDYTVATIRPFLDRLLAQDPPPRGLRFPSLSLHPEHQGIKIWHADQRPLHIDPRPDRRLPLLPVELMGLSASKFLDTPFGLREVTA